MAARSRRALHLTVSLKPQVDLLDGVFRGSFAPTNPTARFASYQTFILHYAQIASQNNVGYLVIGTKLKSLTMSTYKSNWETIISALRRNALGPDDHLYQPRSAEIRCHRRARRHVERRLADHSRQHHTHGLQGLELTGDSLRARRRHLHRHCLAGRQRHLHGSNHGHRQLRRHGHPHGRRSGQCRRHRQPGQLSRERQRLPAQRRQPSTPRDQATNSSTVTVSATGFGFILTPASTSVAVPQTTSATDTIMVADFGTFTGNVTLTATGFPSGVTCVFTTNPATVTSAPSYKIAPASSTVSVTQGSTATDVMPAPPAPAR